MADLKFGGKNRADEIQKELDHAFKELDQIRQEQKSIIDPDGLQAVEREVIQATDKIAALMTALKIQQAVDSDELSEKANELVQSMPERLKNQGRREVTIQPSRGPAVKVEAPYYSRKNRKNKRRKKKKK